MDGSWALNRIMPRRNAKEVHAAVLAAEELCVGHQKDVARNCNPNIRIPPRSMIRHSSPGRIACFAAFMALRTDSTPSVSISILASAHVAGFHRRHESRIEGQYREFAGHG
jgi:hypothetical protein